ncbi:MAG: hypothetical protein AB1598_01095 [Thermodesulfobacteriota bacterium]
MKYIPLAVLCIPFILSGCIEVGDSGTNPIQGEVVERRALTDEEVAVWNEQAECMETESKSRPDIEDLNATDVPVVPEITIRKDLMCGNIPPDNLIACQSEDEIAILDGLDQETFNRALRHEEIHYILFFETGNGDGGHKSIWFNIDESPCPESGQ